jgi:hypothetical protein
LLDQLRCNFSPYLTAGSDLLGGLGRRVFGILAGERGVSWNISGRGYKVIFGIVS